MTAKEREAWLDHVCTSEEPPEPEEEEGFEPLTLDELAEIRELAASVSPLLPLVISEGRRGPGHSGSARVRPGESASRAAAFGPGMALDVLPACPGLALAADAAAGEDDAYTGVSDEELIGVLCAWDRLEAHMAARKLAAIAELYRRRPGPEGAGCDEFAPRELSAALGESRARAEDLLDLARQLRTRLPGSEAALRDGTLSTYKAQLIMNATELLDRAEAAAAEEKVLDRAGRLTPGSLRAAIARAAMEVAPKKARKRREAAAKKARVQCWAEDSGNAALEGRELPTAEARAASQRITAWAQQLGAAGLDGDMDNLRARAYLDILLDKDSRPRQDNDVGRDRATLDEHGAGPVPAGSPSPFR